MTAFSPTPDYQGHVDLENLLDRVCARLLVSVVKVPNHAVLSELETEVYNKNFSNESLYIRSLPDKLVLTRHPFFVDVKSTYRKNTGNISVELSAYYFDLKRVKQGIHVCFLYETERGEPRVFSPLSHVMPEFIVIQPKWVGEQRRLFLSYVAFIAEHLGVQLNDLSIYNIRTEGSEDPFIVISINSLWECSTNLESFVNQMNREWYLLENLS